MSFPGFNDLFAFTPEQQHELRQFVAYLQGYLETNHVYDGTHGDVQAKSIDVIANAETGATGNVTADGDVTVDGDGVFGGDVIANSGSNQPLGDGQSALRGSMGNASVIGPALVLGPDSNALAWQQIADKIQVSPSIARMTWGPTAESITKRFAMGLSQHRVSPVAGAYYLTPSPVSELWIGAPDTFYGGPTGRVNEVWVKNGIYERARGLAMGDWTDVPFNAANFTADPPDTWTVAAGGQATYCWSIVGRTMTVWFYINGVTGGGAAVNAIRVAVPAGYLASHTVQGMSVQFNGSISTGGAWRTGGSLYVLAGGAFIGIQQRDLATWASGETAIVIGSMTFPVQ